jgi:predicted O-linked N-acetylglucosamine transferase (SPINDLY family)
MPSLMELVERVNKGELVEASQLEIYEDSSNSAEKFLSHHAHAALDLRAAQQHMLQSLEAIDYSDQKVLNQFVAISGFLGLSDLRTAPVVKFAACAIARREFALGMEALASAVSFDQQHEARYTSDRENCLFIASQYERAAHSIGWTSGQPINWDNKQIHVGVIVNNIADDEAATRAVASLAKHHDAARIKLHVYSTEAGVRREKQFFAAGAFVAGSAKRGIATLETLGQRKISGWLCPTDADSVAGAKELANQMIRDRIDVAIFDVGQSDAIASVVAGWEVARAKINLCRSAPIYSPQMNAITYTESAAFNADKDFWAKRNVDARCINEGIDLDDLNVAGPNRTAYGIPENAVVLATAGTDLDRTISEPFVQSMIDVLRAHPQAIYLLVGEADLGWQKRKFESAGVGKRVGYAGRRKDMPGFLKIADVYAAEFPSAGTNTVLAAMAMERPVVALAGTEAVSIAGEEASTGSADASSYIERVSKLIREPAQRARLGKSLRQRVEQQFAFAQTARSIEQICEQTLQKRSAPVAQAQAA